jgi:hypothetical protein
MEVLYSIVVWLVAIAAARAGGWLMYRIDLLGPARRFDGIVVRPLGLPVHPQEATT